MKLASWNWTWQSIEADGVNRTESIPREVELTIFIKSTLASKQDVCEPVSNEEMLETCYPTAF